MGLKRVAYVALSSLARAWWTLTGGRRVRAMGENYRVTPDTVFPGHRHMRLPKAGWRSKIVRYTDFVQLHSCCDYCSSVAHPPTIVDIGAHHGAYAVILGKIARSTGGRVIAVEPNPRSFAVLAKNVRMNGLDDTVVPERVAVTRAAGTAGLVLQGSESYVARTGESGTVEVRAETMEQLLSRHAMDFIDLLMIDVEGAELDVLRGFPWDDIGVGRIFCELHPYNWTLFGYGPKDVRAFLMERGLRCFDMYFQEHKEFSDEAYVGPCLLLQDNAPKSGEAVSEGSTEEAAI